MSQLILHPQSLELRRSVEALRGELAALLSERIRITFEELPGLRYRYTEIFGELEREIERKTLEMSERKRLVELFALKLDRGQKLDEKMIELTMRAVFKEFERIRARIRREAGNEQRKAEGKGWWMPDITTNTDGQTGPQRKKEELRDLYRRLAKRLHPDTRREENRLTETWWELVQRSYQRGDLHALQTLVNIVETSGAKGETGRNGSTESVEVEKERLERGIAVERERLQALKEEEPFSLKEKMEEPEWIEEKKKGLHTELTAIEAEIAKCDKFLAPILAGKGEEVKPEGVEGIWANFLEDVYLSGRY